MKERCRGRARVRRELFGFLQSAETQWKFFARVVDDVDWTVQGTHPLAGRHHEKQQFLDATFAGPLEKGAVARVER